MNPPAPMNGHEKGSPIVVEFDDEIDLRPAPAPEPEAWPHLGPMALTGLPGDVVAAATKNSEADPAAVLATFLTMVGIAIGRGPYLRTGDVDHHPRLFCALVGASARGRKGTSEGAIALIWKSASKALGAPLGGMAWKPGPMSSGEGLLHAIRDPVIDDKGDGDQGVTDKRLLIVDGEMGSALRVMKREGNTLSAIARCLWDGRNMEPMTKASRISVTEPHVGFVGHITEAELKKYLSDNDVFSGFANRFLWWCVRRSRMLPLARGIEDTDVRLLGRLLAEHLRKASEPREIHFNAQAFELYCSLYKSELSVDQGGVYGIVTARAEAQVIRLALIYALLDACDNEIELRHLEAALAVCRFCDASARRIFGGHIGDQLADRILQALARGPLTLTDLNRALGGHSNRKAITAALNLLQGQGRIDGIRKKTDGRPSHIWTLRDGFESAEKGRKKGGLPQ